MQQGTTHIIGAGLAGLSAATRLAEQGRHVVLYEATSQAGGRCRSYHDASLDMVIDNGNHLLLSGNKAARTYLERIGSGDFFASNIEPVFDFVDFEIGKRWTLRLNKSWFPFWLFKAKARVPDTQAKDYFSIIKFLQANASQTILPLLDANSILYKRLWHLLLLSALNTNPSEASTKLAGAILRGTLLKGGKACIPLVADGLSGVFIDPALAFLSNHNASILYNQRLRHIHFEGANATSLKFATVEPVQLGPNDSVICAAPYHVAETFFPGITFPNEACAILNVHFRIAPPAGFPRLMGVINGTVEWIFAFPDRISITISDAERFMQEDRDTLAARIWQEVAQITGLASSLPAWQIVKEKRATFAATPAEDAKRPGCVTPWRNVFLAGDYVQNGLPATIEGTILSGAGAAEQVLKTS